MDVKYILLLEESFVLSGDQCSVIPELLGSPVLIQYETHGPSFPLNDFSGPVTCSKGKWSCGLFISAFHVCLSQLDWSIIQLSQPWLNNNHHASVCAFFMLMKTETQVVFSITLSGNQVWNYLFINDVSREWHANSQLLHKQCSYRKSKHALYGICIPQIHNSSSSGTQLRSRCFISKFLSQNANNLK